MPNHTPGPWSEVHSESGVTIRPLNDTAERGYCTDIASCIEDPANARLIAAAPELAEALAVAQQMILEIQGGATTRRDLKTDYRLSMIDAALRKAGIEC